VNRVEGFVNQDMMFVYLLTSSICRIGNCDEMLLIVYVVEMCNFVNMTGVNYLLWLFEL